MDFFAQFSFRELISTYVVLFAITDVTGNIPVIINMQDDGVHISAKRASIYAFFLMVLFFYGGEAFLRLFGLDLSSFAIAGAFVVFLIGLEMVLNINMFKESAEMTNDATIVPIVFPLFIGAGALTTLLSLRSQYADINVLLSVALISGSIYYAIKVSHFFRKYLSKATIYILKKFFGIILLAMSVKLFVTNVTVLVHQITG